MSDEPAPAAMRGRPVGKRVAIDTLSVLFSDLVGSTELRSRLGDREADELRRIHDRLLTEVVRAHGGSVIKFLGDGMLATFSSAADAVAAAIAIQQVTSSHSQRHPARPLSVRIGVSSGDVAVEDGDVFGTPVVEGARLCAAAAGSEILVSEVVRVLARSRSSALFEPVGELMLKGLPDPVPACRVTWVPAGDEEGAPLPSLLMATAATAYVGRAEMLGRLNQARDEAIAGGYRAVLLCGEPGVGKTRTAAEVARAMHATGGLVLYGRSDEDLGAPYQPFMEALDFYTTHVDRPLLGRLPGELCRLLPELSDRVPGIPLPVTSDPRVEEYRLLEAVASWLIACSQPGGLLLVVDDLHWATKPTLLMLAHLTRTASAADPPARLLVALTYRDTEVDSAHPLWGVVGELRRLPGVERMALSGLSASEVGALVSNAAGHELDEAEQALVRAVHGETEGNPFFVGEVLRHLVETGAVRRQDDRWVIADPAQQVAIPEGVRDVVGRRVARLSPAANTVLSHAAVVGRDWEVEVVLALTGLEEGALLDAVDEAVRARLVDETGADRFRFSHALVQETLYGQLSITRRRRQHRHVAEALERLHPDDVATLSHHWLRAGPRGRDVRRAIVCTLAAARQAQRSRALALAEARYRQVLELADEAEDVDPGVVVDARIGLGECQRDQSDPAYRETLLEAAARARALNDAGRLVSAVLATRRAFGSFVGKVDEERVAMAEAALDVVGEDPCPERARLLAYLSSEIMFTYAHPRRLALVDSAERMARELGDSALLAEVLAGTAFAAITTGRVDELLRRTEEAVHLADATADPSLRIESRIFRALSLVSAGRVREARGIARASVAIAEGEGSPRLRWLARSMHIRHLITDGRFDEADRENDECLALAESLDEPDRYQFWGSIRSALALHRGLEAELAELAGMAAAQYPASISWRLTHAITLAAGGRLVEARTALDADTLDLAGLAGFPYELLAVRRLGELAWLLGDRDLGAAALPVLEAHPTLWVHVYTAIAGPVSWTLGLCWTLVGRVEEGVAALEVAVAAAEREDCPAITTMIRLDLAAALLQRRAVADLECAPALLDTVEAAATASGATGIRERAQRLRDGHPLWPNRVSS